MPCMPTSFQEDFVVLDMEGVTVGVVTVVVLAEEALEAAITPLAAAVAAAGPPVHLVLG